MKPKWSERTLAALREWLTPVYWHMRHDLTDRYFFVFIAGVWADEHINFLDDEARDMIRQTVRELHPDFQDEEIEEGLKLRFHQASEMLHFLLHIDAEGQFDLLTPSEGWLRFSPPAGESVSIYNRRSIELSCPRCGATATMEVSLYFGYAGDAERVAIGDRYPFLPRKAVQNSGEPPGVDFDGKGHTACPACRETFFLEAMVRDGILTAIEIRYPYVLQ